MAYFLHIGHSLSLGNETSLKVFEQSMTCTSLINEPSRFAGDGSDGGPAEMSAS